MEARQARVSLRCHQEALREAVDYGGLTRQNLMVRDTGRLGDQFVGERIEWGGAIYTPRNRVRRIDGAASFAWGVARISPHGANCLVEVARRTGSNPAPASAKRVYRLTAMLQAFHGEGLGMLLKPVHALRRTCAAALTVVLAVSVFSACAAPIDPSAGAPTGIEVSVEGKTQPTVTVPDTLEGPVADGLTELGTVSDMVFGTPVEIELKAEMPASGATLARTYAAPLPEGVAVTFAFWDEEYQVWTAVPTTLSNDRRTATAVVQHFSLWNDFIAGSKEALTRVRDAASKAGQTVSTWAGDVVKGAADTVSTAAEATYWSAGNIFSTRVELPECDLATPNWVVDLPTGFDPNDQVRFCAGHDAAHPELLVVKARPNRGYGFPVVLTTEAQWEYNSTHNASLTEVIATVGQVDAVIGESVSELLNNGRFVGAGDEISFGIAPSALRDYESEFLLELPSPTVPQYIFSTISQLVAAWGVSEAEGTLAAAIVVAHCLSKLGSQVDIGTAASTVMTCATSASDVFVSTLEKSLIAQGHRKLEVGKLLGKISMALWVIPAVVTVAEYASDALYPRDVRALKITVDDDALHPKDSGWLISASGVGPARFDQTQDTADAAFGDRNLRCDGSAIHGWFASVWGDGTNPSMMFVVSEGSDVEKMDGAPATASGVTLGTTADEMIALGYTRGAAGPYGNAFEWEEDGVPFAAATGPDGGIWAIVVGMHYIPAEFCN